MRSDRLLLAFLGIVLIAGCRKKASDADDEKTGPRKVACAPVTTRKVSDTIEVRGTVAPLPDRDAVVSAQVAGRIVKVLVREGDRVRAGQPVAQIDTSPLQDDVSEARAAVAKARAERENAETTLNRVKRVFEGGVAARQEVDDAVARYQSARASEAQAAAAARRATLHQERATVRSPMDGVVLKVMRRSGELADGTAATAIVEIGDPSKLELVGEAPGQDLIRIAPGDPASISIVGAREATFTGKVAAVSPAVDRATGLGVVRTALSTVEGKAPPVGMFGVARIAVGTPRDAILVPAVALRNAAGPEGEVVVCGADHTAHVVRVKTGVRAGDLIEIVGGPRPGERVAVAPVLGIADGDKLEPPDAEGGRASDGEQAGKTEERK
jgi:HlyD family secretion protein